MRTITAIATLLAVSACDTARTQLSPSSAQPPVQTVPVTDVATRGCSLNGVVYESPATPSAGATVVIVKEPGGHSAPVIDSRMTDTAGAYRFDSLDCGVGRLVRAEKADFFPREEAVVFAADTQHNFTLDRLAWSLRGIVRDGASGTALVGTTVTVLSGPYAGQTNTTHHDGSYGLQVRDTVTIRASMAGYRSAEATLTVSAPGAARDFALYR